MLRKLAPSDVVTVTRIDRLARSIFDLFAIVKRIADAKAQFRSLAEPWVDTGTSTGRLYGGLWCQGRFHHDRSRRDDRAELASGAVERHQTCIRSVRADRNHDAVIRIGSGAPGRRVHS